MPLIRPGGLMRIAMRRRRILLIDDTRAAGALVRQPRAG